MRRFRLAVLGGTFDHLHVGHEALLSTAFRVGREVAIGVTTDRFLEEHPKPTPGAIQPYRRRRAALLRYLRRRHPGRRWRVTGLGNAFGRSVEPEVGALVVSPDTVEGGRAVNRERRRLGRPAVPLVVVPLVLADDLVAVSSRRVRAKEIDRNGRRRSRIRVSLVTGDEHDVAPSERAIREVFPRAELSRSGTRRSPRRAGPGYDLEIRVERRRGKSGWTITERARAVRLRPRRFPGRGPRDLERALRSLLRARA